MAERFVGANAQYTSRDQRLSEKAGTPSLDSDILSGSVLPSSLLDFDGNGSGWVLFSPQLEPEETSSHASNALLDHLEPFDLSQPAMQDSGTSTQRAHDLELPSHNGTGSFNLPASSRLDLFERVNAWRIEQSRFFGGDPETQTQNNHTFWQRLKQNTARNIENLLAWDDDTIDALFSKDYGRTHHHHQSEHEHEHEHEGSRQHTRSIHVDRARKYGPPGWEEYVLRNTIYRDREQTNDNNIFVAVLSQLLLWSQKNTDDRLNRRYRPSARTSYPASLLYHPEHSYHMEAIQGSIATVTSTMTAAAWSDTWDTATSTSYGVAAA